MRELLRQIQRVEQLSPAIHWHGNLSDSDMGRDLLVKNNTKNNFFQRGYTHARCQLTRCAQRTRKCRRCLECAASRGSPCFRALCHSWQDMTRSILTRPVHENLFLEFPKYPGRFMLHFDIKTNVRKGVLLKYRSFIKFWEPPILQGRIHGAKLP